MKSFSKSIVISILVSVSILMFANLIYFFPWYMTLVVETFNLSQIAASDNYVKETYYYDALERLQDRPFFNQNRSRVQIIVLNANGQVARGYDDERLYYDLSSYEKPYRQRGEPITVEIRAVFPLSISVWGREVSQEIPVSFSMKTIGLKHYKDLDYYYD